jgi:hypothetical protein
MAKMVARNCSIFLWDNTGACQSISGYSNNAALSYTAEAPEVTSFGDENKTRLSNGLKDYTLDLDVFFDTDASRIDGLFYNMLAGSTMFALGPSGSGASAIKYTACAVCTKFDMKFAVADAATAAISLQNRAGSMTRTTFP